MSLSGVYGPAYSHSTYESNMAKMAGYNVSTFPSAHGLSPRDLSTHVASGPQQVPIQHQPNSHQAQSLPSPVPAMFMPNYSAGRPSQAPLSPISPLLSSVPAIASMPAMTQSSLRVPASGNTRVRHPGVDTLSPLASPSLSSRASTPRGDSMNVSASATLLQQGRAAHLDVNSRFRQQPYFPATSTAGPYHNNATLQIAMELRRQSAPALAGATGGALSHSRQYSLATLSNNNLISDHIGEVDVRDSPSPSSSSGGATPQRRRASRARAALVGRRRRASDLARDFWCPESECSRRYEAWRSLQHHLRADHDVRMRLRDYKVIRHDRGEDLLVDSRGAPITSTSDGDDNNSQSEQQTSSSNTRSTSSTNNKNDSAQGSNNASRESMQSSSGGSNTNNMSSNNMLANSSGDYGDFDDDDEDLAESSDLLRSVLPAMLSDADMDSNMDFFPPRLDAFAGMKVPRRPAPSVARQRTEQERKGSVPRIETTLAFMQSPTEEEMIIVRDLRGIDGQAVADPTFDADFLLSDLEISPSDLLFSTAPLPMDLMHPPLSAARPLYRTDASGAQHLSPLRYRVGNNNVGELSGSADVAVRGQPEFLRHPQPMAGGGAQPQPMTDLFAYNLSSNSYGQLDEFNLLPV